MEKQIFYQNQPVFYKVTGDGYPVVLIHGVPADSSIWHNQEAFLCSRYKLILPDLPGSGKSGLTTGLSIDSMAEMINCILDEEEISEAVIIGHSMGGYISVAMAENYPGKVKALGFFHSSAYADSDEKKETRKKNTGFIRKHGSHEFIKQTTPGLFSDDFKKDHADIINNIIEKYKNFNQDSLAAYQQAMMVRSDKRKVLEQWEKPVLFIIGEYDKAVPFQDSIEQSHIPRLAYIHILKNSGHMGMLEETDKSNDILNMFLKDVC